MKKQIPIYKLGEVETIEKTISKHNLKVIEKFLVFCGGSAGKSKLVNIRRVMIKIADTLETDLDKLDLNTLRAFNQLLKESEMAPATKNEIKKYFKRFLKEQYSDWSKRFKGLEDIKLEKDINQEKINGNSILTNSDLDLIMRNAETLRLKALIMLNWETAGRPEELYKLKWKDLDLDKEEVKLHSSKTGNVRVLPLKNCIIHLARYKQEYPFPNVQAEDYVFPSRDRNKQMNKIGYGYHLKKIGENVLGRHLFPYLFRHSRLTQLHKILPPKVYEKYADHSLSTATRYSHLDKDDVKEVFAREVYKVKELTPQTKHKLEQKIELFAKVLNAIILNKPELADIQKNPELSELLPLLNN